LKFQVLVKFGALMRGFHARLERRMEHTGGKNIYQIKFLRKLLHLPCW